MRDIPIITLLVGGAPLPNSEELPPRLRELPNLQSLTIHDDGPEFRNDMERLRLGINRLVHRPKRIGKVLYLSIALLLGFAGGFLVSWMLSRSPVPPGPTSPAKEALTKADKPLVKSPPEATGLEQIKDGFHRDLDLAGLDIVNSNDPASKGPPCQCHLMAAT